MDKHTVLKEYFGYDSFVRDQEKVIDAILSGRDVMTIMPTGGGKSLCYQIPAILLDGCAIVVSPLISLMKDQVNALNLSGVKSAYINSSLSEAQRIEVIKRAREGAYTLIYVAPEQLLTPRFLSLAKDMNISLLAVDEAHCVSQWGQDFRPGYLDIDVFVEALPKRPIVAAFTATATLKIQENIVERLKLNDPLSSVSGFDRSNLYYEVRHDKDKFAYVDKYVKEHSDAFGIVYCQTRKEVESVASRLGSIAGMYHAGMPIDERNAYQDQFLRDEIQVMVATNAFGMGIDKSNVSYVIHYNMPKNVESYYQEAGRAGRDGSKAECILLYSGRDVVTANYFIDNAVQNDSMDEASFQVFQSLERERLRQMISYSKTTSCLRQFVLDYFNDVHITACDNCFNCTGEFDLVDVGLEAQMILSCIVRMGERFGAAMVSDVLRGSRNKRVLDHGFDQLSTHGIMKSKSSAHIRMVIDYLLEEDVLSLSNDAYATLKLGSKASSALKGQEKLVMRVSQERVKSSLTQDVSNPELFDRLRSLRKSIADERGVPAFVVFSDASLKSMCAIMPQSLESFLSVSGVGSVKAEAYGEAFLEVIKKEVELPN